MPLWILGKTYAPSGCAAPALLPEDPPNPLVLSGAQTKGFLGSSNGKRICLQCRRLGFDPWSGRSPGEGNGYPLQYSCLGNSMEKGAWWATCPPDRKESNTTERQTLALSGQGEVGTRSRLPCRQLGHLGTRSSSACLLTGRERCAVWRCFGGTCR